MKSYHERIRLLAKEADKDIGEDVSLEFCEKFAELLIRECASTLHDMHLWQSVNNQNYPSPWHDAVDQGIDAIKEHFGVNE